jgi:hypothetical protein
MRSDDGGQVVGEMHDRTILHIRPLPDGNGLDVPAENGSIENAGVLPEMHIAH